MRYNAVTVHAARPNRVKLSLMLGIVGLGASLFACGGGPDPPESNWTLEEARQFDEFPLYWLGEDYQGLPLTAITRYEPATPTEAVVGDVVDFWYGEITYKDSAFNARVWIRIEPYCDGSDSSPEAVQSFLNGPLASAGFLISPIEIRGVEGYLVDMPRLHLWAGPSAIQINSNDSTISMQQVAEDLFPVAEGPSASPHPLPPPISTEC
jgi:hypothetical protein